MDTCDCSQDAIDLAISKSVKNSTELISVFQNLQAHVQYCVQSIGTYRVIEEFRAEPEVTCGGSVSIQTDGGERLCACLTLIVNHLSCSWCPGSSSN